MTEGRGWSSFTINQQNVDTSRKAAAKERDRETEGQRGRGKGRERRRERKNKELFPDSVRTFARVN
jgi:hypothetical protein